MKDEKKQKLINIGIGVLIGAIITSICFIICINVKGVGRRHDFDGRPQMTHSQEFRKDDKGKQAFPNAQKKNSNDGNSTSTPSQEQPSQPGQTNS